MSDIIPEFAPGCFGSTLSYKKDDATCVACPFSDKCAPVYETNLIRLRELLGIKEPYKRGAETQPKPVDPRRAKLPQKTQKLLEKIDKGNFDIINNLKLRKNPFDSTLPQMAIACHLLLRLGRPLKRETLINAFMESRGWGRRTAEEQARSVFISLIYFGAADCVDGTISLKDTF